MDTATKQTIEPEHICPIHFVKLSHLLKGGVGYCGKCGLYVQSANHPPVELDPHIAAKREAAAQPKPKAKKTKKAKSKKRTKAKRPARQIRPDRDESGAGGVFKYFP